MTAKHVAALCGACLVLWGAVLLAADAERAWGKYAVDGRRSGYTYAAPETRAMQDDEFDNPGSLWLARGETLWHTVDGQAGKSCASCHGEAASTMHGVAARYPLVAGGGQTLVNVERRINQCRVGAMGARAWASESEPLLAMTTYVKHQSLDLPVAPVIDGSAAPFFAKGKAIYESRRGQLDLACVHCHEMNHGNFLRAQRLSEGMSNGFPLYRLKWQTLGSLQRRMSACMRDIGAEPYADGADEYVELELYLAWRARGLPVETPAVRN
jgi:L-cysteine S-thiosulfotransferase